MKKLLFVLLIFIVATSYAQIPSYMPTNGLVAYYPFNGNANDVSGNGNNGTAINGALLTSDRNGNANSAYSFDGVDDRIYINNSFFNNGWNSFTISGWYYLNNQANPINGNSSHCILNTSPHNGLGFGLNWGSSNKYSIFVGTGAPSTSWNVFFDAKSNQNIALNNWKFITLIKNSNTYYLFVNGALDQTWTATTAVQSYLYKLYLGGADPLNSNEVINGKLDDIAIYNRALSQSEITGLYNAGTNTCLPSYIPTTGLVGYLPFCGNANDESGNGYNGTVSGATLTTDRFGNVGKAYHFNGILDSNGSKIQTSFPGILGSASRSISVWVKRNQLISNHSAILEWGNPTISGGSTGIFMSYIASSNPYIGIENATSYVGNQFPSILDGNWHNYIFVYDNTISNNLSGVKIYIDKILVSNNVTYGSSNLNNQLLINLVIGQFYPGQDNRTFNGDIDDLAIYNRALSATEIQNLYNASAPTTCIANIINNDTTICKGQSLTLNADAVASGSVIDINGNVYPTVNIGSQTWMQKNLNVSKYKNGDVIPQVTDATQWANLTTGAWCWYNNDSATYASTYGKLYNWYAVNDSRGLAPDGWHVPNNSEWSKLIKYIDAEADTICVNCNQSLTAGGNLKDTGTIKWLTPNTGATNSTNFTALPGGARFGTSFTNWRVFGYWWTNSEFSSNDAYFKSLNYLDTKIASGYSTNLPINKNNGYSVRCLRNNITYLWSTGATTPSITVSPLVTTTYYCTVSDGVNTCTDSVKITVGATAIPSAPATLTGATDVCPNFSSPTSATSNAVTYTAATVSTASSYTWTVPAGVTLVSGQGTNSITVTFASTFVSGAISVKSVNACGSSTSAKSLTVYKRVAATPGTIQKEFTPTSIVAVTNVTGLVSETYRIKKVTYATSYNWSMNQGTNATITHINPLGVNDTAVIVTFASCFIRDTLSVKAVTPCSVSTARTSILYAYSTPASVLGITTIGGNFATCIGVNKTFTAVRGTPTTTQAPIASFRWTRPANTSIVSATSDSASITVSFNTGYTGGSISAKGVSQCGTIGTTASTAILQFLPPGVLSIASSTGSYNACIGNNITYSALVSAPTTSQVAATVFRWTKPNNTSITSASTDSSTITLQFNTGYIGGTLSVRGQTSCGTLGTAKNQTLTHAGCAAGTKMAMPITTTEANSFEVSLYPNPSAGEFKLLVNFVGGKTSSMATNLVGGKTPTMATVKVIDLQGRLIKSFQCNANQVTALGNELKPGVYMVEVRMGNEVKTVRAVRF